jgi:hypothetical protein
MTNSRTFGRKVNALLFGAAAAVNLQACGGGDDSEDQVAIVLPERVFNPPASYPLADEGCQTRKEPTSLTRTVIPGWQGDEVKMVPVTLTDTVTSQSLRNSIVKDTVFGVEYERRCDAGRGESACLDQFGQERDYKAKEGVGWLLRVCDDDHTYDRKSVETVALASAYYLDIAHRKYMALKEDKAATPEQLLLNVLPQFTDVYDNFVDTDGERKVKKVYIVNNLAYYGSKRMVIVFPSSQQVDRLYPGYFWESQFVLAHEYGHHIERMRTGFLTGHLSIEWNPLSHSWEDGEQLTMTGSGKTEFTQMLGAVSEGFADLLAFYAEGGTSFSLSGIPRLGANRDIRLATFANKDEKILTTERFNVLTLRNSDPDDSDESYGDIHRVGAIIAHTADKIFKVTSLARDGIEEGSGPDMDYRYKMVLRWISEVGEGLSLTKDEGGAAQLARLSDAFATVVNETVAGSALRSDVSAEDLRRDVCEVLADSLPALAKPAFQLDGGC